MNRFIFLKSFMEIFVGKNYFADFNQRTPDEFRDAFQHLAESGNKLGLKKSVATLDGLLTAFCATEYVKTLASSGDHVICNVFVTYTTLETVIEELERLSYGAHFPRSEVCKYLLRLCNIQENLCVLHPRVLQCHQNDEDLYNAVRRIHYNIRNSLKIIITNQTIYHSIDELAALFTDQERARTYNLVKFAFAHDGKPILVTESLASAEVAKCLKWMPLWLKVWSLRTRHDLLQLAPQHLCGICIQVNLGQAENFAIFDLCGHIFCVECATSLLAGEGKKRCPYCRRNVGAWMTLETFTKHRVAMDTRQVFDGRETTTLMERVVIALKKSSGLGALFFTTVVCAGIAYYICDVLF